MAEILDIDAEDANASQLLESYIQSGNLNFLIGSGASSPAIPIAGNIEAEIDELIVSDKQADANLKCLDLIEQMFGVQALMAANLAAGDIHNVVVGYQKFLQVLDRILFARKNILLPRQATIFSTNYDMFVEHAASLVPSVILNDGFDRSSSLSSEFMFTPERFFDRTYRSGPVYGRQIEIPTINLVKLHGSLSWRRSSDTIVFDPVRLPPLTDEQKANEADVNARLEKYFLILPNFRKYHSTLMERVYYDLLRLFSKAMDQENAVLISFGFSFVDDHILDLTRRTLRNPTSQLIIMAYNHASAAAYQAKFSKQRNVTIFSPSPGGASIDFQRLENIFSSILPILPDGK